MEKILALDQSLFFQINGCHNLYFDNLFFMITNQLYWIPFFLVLLFIIARSEHSFTKILCFIVLVALTIVIADQISSSILKPLVARPRPSRDPIILDMVHTVNGYRGGRFSFVSSHAANSFGIALLLSLGYSNYLLSIVTFIWASIFSYSRIYIGVHYPTEIFGGLVVGCFASVIVFLLYKLLARYQEKCVLSSIKGSDSLTISAAFLLNLLVLLLIAFL